MSEFEKELKEKLEEYRPHHKREECFKDGAKWAYIWIRENHEKSFTENHRNIELLNEAKVLLIKEKLEQENAELKAKLDKAIKRIKYDKAELIEEIKKEERIEYHRRKYYGFIIKEIDETLKELGGEGERV